RPAMRAGDLGADRQAQTSPLDGPPGATPESLEDALNVRPGNSRPRIAYGHRAMREMDAYQGFRRCMQDRVLHQVLHQYEEGPAVRVQGNHFRIHFLAEKD